MGGLSKEEELFSASFVVTPEFHLNGWSPDPHKYLFFRVISAGSFEYSNEVYCLMPSWLGAFNLPSMWTATVERGQGEGSPCGHQQPWGCDGQQVSTWSLLLGRTVLV